MGRWKQPDEDWIAAGVSSGMVGGLGVTLLVVAVEGYLPLPESVALSIIYAGAIVSAVGGAIFALGAPPLVTLTFPLWLPCFVLARTGWAVAAIGRASAKATRAFVAAVREDGPQILRLMAGRPVGEESEG